MALNIVITMAGRGSRFKRAGYAVPKYEIVVHGRSLFEWSMRSLKHFLLPDSRVIFVCLDENESTDYVMAQSEALGLKDVHIVNIPEITDGQATSAYISRELWYQEEPLLIYNIDTYVSPTELTPSSIRFGSDGWVPCFKALGNHWSFVKLGADHWAVDIAEKQRISEYATIGLYWFSRAQDYVDAYEQYFADPDNLVGGERYVAPLYKYLIQNECKVSISDLPIENVHVLGTPDELDSFMDTPKDRLIDDLL